MNAAEVSLQIQTELKRQNNPYKHGMKAKTVKDIIRRKMDGWFQTITDETLLKRVANNTIVTGGCIASMLLGEEINDFDVYFRDHDTALEVARYYLSKFNPKEKSDVSVPMTVVDEGGRVKIVVQSAGVASENGTKKPYQYFEGQPDESAAAYLGEVLTNPEQIEDTYQGIEDLALTTVGKKGSTYRPVFITTNAITLSDKVQIVIRFYGEPDAIHENYDFIHCTNYWSSWDNGLVLRTAALEALLARDLRYVGSKYPVCSLIRLRKFINRGWRVSAGQILKIVMQVNDLDLKNIKVLEDQLTGVDSAYFVQLIRRLNEKDPTQVDGAYLVQIIDELF